MSEDNSSISGLSPEELARRKALLEQQKRLALEEKKKRSVLSRLGRAISEL